MVLFSLFFAFKSSFNLDRLKLICKVNKEKSVAKISCSKEHISETGTGNAMNVRRTGIASVGCFCLRLPTFDCCPPRSRGERERESAVTSPRQSGWSSSAWSRGARSSSGHGAGRGGIWNAAVVERGPNSKNHLGPEKDEEGLAVETPELIKFSKSR